MSAPILGQELLQEIEEQTLDVLLRSLRQSFSSSSSQLGVARLDRLLDVFQIPPVLHQQSHHTQNQRATQENDTHSSVPILPNEKPPPAVEVTSATACSGKTQLLYHIITIALLPQSHKNHFLHGRESAVVLFDLSHKFSILRLRDVMHGYICSRTIPSNAPPSEVDLKSLIDASLAHLHLFRPHSTPSLLSTLDSLPTYLLAQPSPHVSANRPLGLLVLSDLSTFFHQDRLESEELANSPQPTTTTTTRSTNTFLHFRYHHLITSLLKTQLLFSAPLVATTYSLNTPSSSSSTHPSLRPHLPTPWSQFCTLQLVVQRDQVTKFGPGMSIEEASGEEKAQRWEAVRRSGFSGWVNWWGSGGWREEVKEGLRGLEGGGRFGFWVDARDVRFEDDEGDGGGDGGGEGNVGSRGLTELSDA